VKKQKILLLAQKDDKIQMKNINPVDVHEHVHEDVHEEAVLGVANV
jgi:hypothetical protein